MGAISKLAISHHEGHDEGKALEFESPSRDVIGCTIEAHKALGPGLLERAYEECLAHELGPRGIGHGQRQPLPTPS